MAKQKNNGGNTMSLKTRLALLASSSLAMAIGLAPAAWAADECAPANPPTTLSDGVNGVSDPTLNGAAADSFSCAMTPYASGITYTSSGNLTVTKTSTGQTAVTANGVNLNGSGGDSVTFDSSIGDLTGGAGTAGPVIDVSTGTGAITIVTGSVSGAVAGATHAIRAASAGDGDITISRGTGVWNNGVAGGFATVEATSHGGDIVITNSSTGDTTGRARAIRAETSGAGTITISLASRTNINNTDGVAAIETQAGAGATIIYLTARDLNSGTNNAGASGFAIRATSASSTAVSVQNTGSIINGPVDFSGVTAGGVTFNNTGDGRWRPARASLFSNMADTLNIGGGDVSFFDNNRLAAGGSISFGGGADIFNLSSVFDLATGTTIEFGAGADIFNISGRLTANGAMVNFGTDADALNITGVLTATGVTLDFGSGSDTFTQSGTFFPNGVTTVNNLEAFNNSGAIYLGGTRDFAGFEATDGRTDTALKVTSGVFTGSGTSRILLDVNLGAHGSQLGCSTPTVADCIDFTGTTTAGTTLLNVADNTFSVDGGTLGAVITLVQGATESENFQLDPASRYYADMPSGPAIRKPVVTYTLVYDADAKRHMLVGAPSPEIFEVGTYAASVQEVWRATTGSWLTRQADLRAAPDGLQGGGIIWGRVGGQSGERNLATTYEISGLTLNYDLAHQQRIAHMMFGADFLGAASDDRAWVLGGMIGYARSDVEFDASPTEAVTSGVTGGLYASYVAGPLFIDGVFNANILHSTVDAPAMNLGLDVPMKFDIKSLGGQVEAGWRFEMDSSIFLEPLMGVSYIVTRIDDTEVPGGSGQFDFEESKSLRLGGGARVGVDGELLGMTASYSLTGRYWSESEGEGATMVTTASSSSALLPDDFSGGFGEVGASLGLYSQGGRVSGFTNLGGKFADGYQSVDGSIGVRVRW